MTDDEEADLDRLEPGDGQYTYPDDDQYTRDRYLKEARGGLISALSYADEEDEVESLVEAVKTVDSILGKYDY